MPEILTRPRVEFDQDVEERLDTDHHDDDYGGWWCIQTDPWPCPATGCGFVAHHMTAAHRIIVWPELDDPRLLRHANNAKSVDRNPRVINYEPGFGPCITYDAWEAMGRPVHGVAAHPKGGW